MIRVKNGKVISRLSTRSLRANKTRNLVAVAAIVLTTLLFTTLFTVSMSMNKAFQQSNFRQVGGYSHGTFKYLTEDQYGQLKDDPLIKEYGLRRFLGMPEEEPFNKTNVEISYCDETEAKFMFCLPEQGSLPREGTNEAAADTKVLSLLGLEPEIGQEFTVSFNVSGKPTTQTFTLCGWWTADEAAGANNIILPESRVEAVLAELGVSPQGGDLYGSYSLDVMFKSSLHIDENMQRVLEAHGFQNGEKSGDGFIATGVNWGYTGAWLSDGFDPTTAAAIIGLLLVIALTGYLIIYNVFQISVAGDIRFYGMLKTIGMTPRQIKRIIRRQALILSAFGIPIGLVLGWLVGRALTPVITSRLNDISADVYSSSPLIFAVSAVFSLLTVIISCGRPGRLAARVSPIEAANYTEGGNRRGGRRRAKKASLIRMAFANLGRSRGKTAVTVVSLSLAVLLLTITFNFAGGFDMNKYVSKFVSSDFVLANAKYFQRSAGYDEANAVSEQVISDVKATGLTVDGARVYGTDKMVTEAVTEEYYRQKLSRRHDSETVDSLADTAQRDGDGRIVDYAQLYGMEGYALDKLEVVEGDLSRLAEDGGRYIAAVYSDDDYGGVIESSNWAKVGDTVSLRYVDEFKYVDPYTGEETNPEDGGGYVVKAEKYHDEVYTVAAEVVVPSALSYRYYGNDEFVLNTETFKRNTGTVVPMLYAWDAADDSAADMERFIADYTQNMHSELGYESRMLYEKEYESFRLMFILLGATLSGIVALVGILNFFNAVLTGIVTRRREFAMLQSIGMTGGQLKKMLICEGLFYAVGSLVLSAALTLTAGPLIATVFEKMFWFFSYKLTLTPILAVAPVFALLGILLPLLCYRSIAGKTIVERLSRAE